MRIHLSNGGVTLIDREDFKLVAPHIWRKRVEGHTSYAYTVKRLPVSEVGKKVRKIKYIQLHRLLLGLTDPKIVVDHINHDGLDNRRENIRPCTQVENMKNRKNPNLI